MNQTVNQFIGLVAVFVSLNAAAQSIKGKITDENRQPIPYATVYLESLQTGTNSNINGDFEISVKPGRYKLVFRSLGYKQVVREVVVGNVVQTLNVTLPTEVYQIKEVVVKQGDEDPAYAIMRKAIAWAPYHLNMVSHYQSDVYLKGTMVIEKIPKLMKGKVGVSNGKSDVQIKSGDVYLDESLNEITFDVPNKYKQRVKSSQSSFPNFGNEAMAPIDFIKSSLYQPDLFGFISPLAPNAFAHYKFVYEGFFEEGNYVVNKIRVEPRRKSQQLFNGHLYIVEDYWTIHSADLENEQFWGTMRVNQLCTPMKDNVWLPVTYNFHFVFNFLSFKGQYRYSSSVKYTDIKVDKRLSGPIVSFKDTIVNSRSKVYSDNAEVQGVLGKEKLTNRDVRKLVRASQRAQKQLNPDTTKSLEIKRRINYTVDSAATKHDTLYWAENRAIPLTADEVKSYQRKDSVIKDTSKLDKKHKPKLFSKVLFGFNAPSKDSTSWFKYKGLLNPGNVTFNTVDGWTFRQAGSVNIHLDTIQSLSISPELTYAFNRRVLMGALNAQYDYAPRQNGQIMLSLGSHSIDFNQASGISPFMNTVTSLFFRENYMKLFDDKYIHIQNEIDLSNGLKWTASANLGEYTNLSNHSDYSFFYRNQREYSMNQPDNDFFKSQQQNRYKSFTVSTGLTYTPEYYYYLTQRRKMMLRSKYPTFQLTYTQGISGVLESNSAYQLISGGIKQTIRLNERSSVKYNVEAGKYFNVNQIHFSEFKHFNTQPLPVTTDGINGAFQMLDFYKYSTARYYLEGHGRFETQLLLLKYLPLISNTFWSENVYFNYLTTPVLKNYVEVGYGLGNILFMADLGIFVSFEQGRYQSVGARVSIGFGK